MRDRRWIVTSGAGVVLIGSFLPWVASGSRSRSSYDLLDIVDRLGFSPDGVVGWAVRLWPLLPLLLVTTVVSHHLRATPPWLPAAQVSLTALSALFAGAVALAVRTAPDVGLFQVRVGTWVTLAGALVLALALVLSAWSRSATGVAQAER